MRVERVRVRARVRVRLGSGLGLGLGLGLGFGLGVGFVLIPRAGSGLGLGPAGGARARARARYLAQRGRERQLRRASVVEQELVRRLSPDDKERRVGRLCADDHVCQLVQVVAVRGEHGHLG